MCASKWISKNLFENYVEEKQKETSEKPSFVRRTDSVWQSPQAGTPEKAKVYEGRFIPDQRGKFTKKYMYHMWKSGDKWIFYLCPKTHGMDKFCPMCAIVSSLYMGTADDKKMAFKMKRKERHVGNFYVVDDPRDKEQDDEAKKASGKVKLYEFPGKLESKLKNEILDKKEGLGFAIFDPGSEGHNIIIKIKSTKPDKNNNTYPDYADSIFSRKPSPLADSDAEIKTIMSSTYDIDEYIKSMEMSKEDTIKMLKNEMLFDMVEVEWNRAYGEKSDTVGEAPATKSNVKSNVKSKAKDEDDVPDSVGEEKSEDLSDEDLLNELKNI
jgi:hypothetical protein